MVDDPDPVVREAKARVGNVLAKKYRLEKLLGIGGMAAVYLATHRNGNRVAIKILHREVSLDGEARSRFLLEGYTANKLDHPDTARVLDDEIAEDGSAFLVVELLEGETYEERAANRRLPHREVMEMAHALLDVLAAAADKGIVHRDIKPENLFHTTSGTLKVLDFGIARVGDTRMAQATRTGLVFGTPAFMPPEQALGKTKEIDHRTDVWAVGATMFTLLSGRFVHEAETPAEHLVFSASRPAPSLAEVAPKTPPAVVAIVDRALRFSREERWQSARDMQRAIEEAFKSLYGAPPPPRRGKPRPKPALVAAVSKLKKTATISLQRARRSRRAVWIAAPVAVLAAALAAWSVLGDGQAGADAGGADAGGEDAGADAPAARPSASVSTGAASSKTRQPLAKPKATSPRTAP
jgi:serine/threonine-protein kinase